MKSLPLFIRRIIFDFLTTAAPTLLALQVAGDTASLLHAAALASGSALVASLVRNLPGFGAYLQDVLALEDHGTEATVTQ